MNKQHNAPTSRKQMNSILVQRAWKMYPELTSRERSVIVHQWRKELLDAVYPERQSAKPEQK